MEQDKNQSVDYAQGVQDTLQTIFENQQKIENTQNNDDGEITIDLGKIAKKLLAKWWQIMAVTILFAVIGFVVATFLVTPKYQSTVSVYVNNNSYKGQGEQYYTTSDLAAAQSLVDTYIVILNSHTTLDKVISNLNLPYTYEQLKGMISAEAQDETEIFAVTVTAEDPIEAQEIANGIAQVLPDSIADVMEDASIRIVDAPQMNPKAVSPNTFKYMLVFALLGFILIVVIIAVLDILDKKVSDEGFVNQLQDAPPLLATIPELDSKTSKKKNGYGYASVAAGKSLSLSQGKIADPFLCDNLSFDAQEAYKLLRTNIIFSLPDKDGCRIIGLTSGQQAETKTTTSINLAYFLAQTGKKVLLIEGDLRLPNIANRMKIRQKPGLSNVLAGFCNVRDAMQKSQVCDNWFVITGGDVPPNPSELMGSKRMASVLDDFRKIFDYVIIDLPPVGVVSDALVLAPSLDGICLVVRENYSLIPEVEEAIRRLNHKGVNLMGITYTGATSAMKAGGYRKKNGYHSYG